MVEGTGLESSRPEEEAAVCPGVLFWALGRPGLELTTRVISLIAARDMAGNHDGVIDFVVAVVEDQV